MRDNLFESRTTNDEVMVKREITHKWCGSRETHDRHDVEPYADDEMAELSYINGKLLIQRCDGLLVLGDASPAMSTVRCYDHQLGFRFLFSTRDAAFSHYWTFQGRETFCPGRGTLHENDIRKKHPEWL